MGCVTPTSVLGCETGSKVSMRSTLPPRCVPRSCVFFGFGAFRKGGGDDWKMVTDHYSGQITDQKPQKVALWKGNGSPNISQKYRLVKYYSIWPDY